MEKNLKKLKIVTIVIFIVLITMIAFVGFYVRQANIWKNVLPDYNFGMEIAGLRELRYTLDSSSEEKEVYVDENGNIAGVVKNDEQDTAISLVQEDENTEEQQPNTEAQTENEISGYTKETRTIKANEDSALTKENFESAKKIIQKRLESMDLYQYNIRLDAITGDLVIEIPNNDNVETIESLITTVGKIEVIDEQTGLVLMRNDDINKASVLVSNQSGYQVYLQLAFNEAGKEKLKEISNKYITTVNDAGEETTEYITITLDDQTLVTTYFGEELSDGIIQIPMGEATTDYQQYTEISQSANQIVKIINEEKMPVVYQLTSDNLIKSQITDKIMYRAEIIFLIIMIVISIIMTIKYRANGLLGAILNVGYIALVTLIIRYTNVNITLNGIVAFCIATLIQYIFMMQLLYELQKSNNAKHAFGNAMKRLYLSIIPICIIAIIFTIMSSITINSIGMILFWGIFIQAIYNTIVVFILNIFEKQ